VPRDVIIFVADGVGAAFLSLYPEIQGSPSVDTPHLEKLALEGRRIAYSSVASMSRTQAGNLAILFGKDVALTEQDDPISVVRKLGLEDDHLLSYFSSRERASLIILPRKDVAWIRYLQRTRSISLYLEREKWSEDGYLLDPGVRFKITDIEDYRFLHSRLCTARDSFPPQAVQPSQDTGLNTFDRLSLISDWIVNATLDLFTALRESHDNTAGIFAYIVDPTPEFFAHWLGSEAYAVALERTDTFVGKIASLLGQDDMFIFTSDHGMHFLEKNGQLLGDHRQRDLESVKYVPEIWYGPCLAEMDFPQKGSILDIFRRTRAILGNKVSYSRTPRGAGSYQS